MAWQRWGCSTSVNAERLQPPRTCSPHTAEPLTSTDWGTRYETYNWNITSHRPIGFGHPWAVVAKGHLQLVEGTPHSKVGVRCWPVDDRLRLFHGPFAYQKGQLYFLDTALAKRFVRDPLMTDLGASALASTDRKLSSLGNKMKEPMYAVWEDVWLGFALSQLRQNGAVIWSLLVRLFVDLATFLDAIL